MHCCRLSVLTFKGTKSRESKEVDYIGCVTLSALKSCPAGLDGVDGTNMSVFLITNTTQYDEEVKSTQVTRCTLADISAVPWLCERSRRKEMHSGIHCAFIPLSTFMLFLHLLPENKFPSLAMVAGTLKGKCGK